MPGTVFNGVCEEVHERLRNVGNVGDKEPVVRNSAEIKAAESASRNTSLPHEEMQKGVQMRTAEEDLRL